jgi:hypothetical protein
MRYVLAALAVVALAALPAGAQVTDTTPPEVTCASDDGSWHNVNVSLACTATDPETGIPNPADQAFNLTTSILDGQETANASTDSRNVCNGAAPPLCTQAGPITGIKVDRRAPRNPTHVRSTDHRVGKWSRDRTITMAFNAGADSGIGVMGFSRAWTMSNSSQPDNAVDLGPGARKTTSSRLGNGRWFFHLRTGDLFDQWNLALHRGPYLIDFAKPRVRALSAIGKTNRKIRLRYRTADNNNHTREKLTISRNGSVVERWSKSMGTARWWNIQGVSWRTGTAGTYSFCARVWDPAGNMRRDCAQVRVKAPAPSGGGGGGGCDSSYPTVCIPSPPPDLDCPDVLPLRNFVVRPPDPHGFDGDHDGRGCES